METKNVRADLSEETVNSCLRLIEVVDCFLTLLYQHITNHHSDFSDDQGSREGQSNPLTATSHHSNPIAHEDSIIFQCNNICIQGRKEEEKTRSSALVPKRYIHLYTIMQKCIEIRLFAVRCEERHDSTTDSAFSSPALTPYFGGLGLLLRRFFLTLLFRSILSASIVITLPDTILYTFIHLIILTTTQTFRTSIWIP